jgi:hypothetical protein
VARILEAYPVPSITKVRPTFGIPGIPGNGVWKEIHRVAGADVSLDDIEHRTLRADFREPRVHFALVCAARSCPALRAEAYRATDLDRQLDDQGRTFLRDPAKNRFASATGTLHLSAIFGWFRADFEAASGSLQAFVARYLGDPAATAPDVEIRFLDYDWALNE